MKVSREIVAALIGAAAIVAAAFIGKAADAITIQVGPPSPGPTVTVPATPAPTVTVTAPPPGSNVPQPDDVLWGPREMLFEDLQNVDLDTAPPTKAGSGADNDLNYWARRVPLPVVTVGGPLAAILADGVLATNENCADIVSRLGEQEVTAAVGSTICIKTNVGNHAALEVLEIDDTARTLGVMVTVWQAV